MTKPNKIFCHVDIKTDVQTIKVELISSGKIIYIQKILLLSSNAK